jgi:tripartite-type tricarboxylate transporter receptor subunit TctC
MHRFTRLGAAAIVAGAALLASNAGAQDKYPDHAITFLVPYAAGANGDIVSRILAADLQKELGQPVVVENKPGAGGNIGAAEVAHDAPDGYTIMLATNTHTINQNLYSDAGFDLRTDFDAVSQITTTWQLLLVNPKLPAKSVQEFIDLAKSKTLTFSSGGNGSSGHLYMELFAQKTGIKLTHIPYKGVAAGLTDLIAGRVDSTFSSISSTNEMIKAGQLRALAIAAPDRSPLLPDVPTLTESGVQGMEAGTWQGIVVPHGTPKEIIDTLNAAIHKSLAEPSVLEQLNRQGVDTAPSTPDEFTKFIADDIDRWHDVITKAGITIQ